MKKLISILMTLSLLLVMAMPLFANEIPTPKPVEGLDGIIGVILGIVQAIALAFAVGMLLYLGIKYMMSSANEKADLKKGSINYVIGAVICLGAAGIIQVIQGIADNIGE